MNFEAGNKRCEEIWRDFVAEQNEEWSKKRVVFCSYCCFLESDKMRCEKIVQASVSFLFTWSILKQFFKNFLVLGL